MMRTWKERSPSWEKRRFVVYPRSASHQILTNLQLDGFKLHVTNSTRPFVSKLRTTPEVASRPARIEKDLAQVKQLVAILEAESAKLRRFAPPKSALPTSKDAKEPNGVKKEEADGDRPEEVKEEDIDLADESQIEPDPPETGSEAIERRVEKIVSELQEHQTPAELDSGVGFDTKKVLENLIQYRRRVLLFRSGCYCARSICCLCPQRVQCLLLLCGYYRSC